MTSPRESSLPSGRTLLLDRDVLLSEATHRAGTPQARHVHVLLAGGLRALDVLFPGFESDLVAAGAVPLRIGLDIRIELSGYDPFPQREFGIFSYSISRPLLEFKVRQRLEQYANIDIRSRCRADELITTSDGAAVAGVRCESGGHRDTLPADFIVDASGRGALTLSLLDRLGLPRPQETSIGVDISYATSLFDIPHDAPPDWKGVATFARIPDSAVSALMLPIEGSRWMATIATMHGNGSPRDKDEFLACAKALPTPTLFDAIGHMKGPADVARFAFPASMWRHFKLLTSFPRGLIPIADAICRLNPVYCQGMSVAAQQACLLHTLMNASVTEHEPLAGLAFDFFTKAHGLIETPWAMAASMDLAHPATRGHRRPDFESRTAFSNALTQLAAFDPDIHKLMLEVQHLLKPPTVYHDRELLSRIKTSIVAR